MIEIETKRPKNQVPSWWWIQEDLMKRKFKESAYLDYIQYYIENEIKINVRNNTLASVNSWYHCELDFETNTLTLKKNSDESVFAVIRIV